MARVRAQLHKKEREWRRNSTRWKNMGSGGVIKIPFSHSLSRRDPKLKILQQHREMVREIHRLDSMATHSDRRDEMKMRIRKKSCTFFINSRMVCCNKFKALLLIHSTRGAVLSSNQLSREPIHSSTKWGWAREESANSKPPKKNSQSTDSESQR